MFRTFSGLILSSALVISAVAADVSVSLTGTVKDISGTPVPGALVTLQNKPDLEVISGNEGTFALTYTGIKTPNVFSTPSSFKVCGKGRYIQFSLNTSVDNAAGAIFSSSGRKVESISLGKLSAGTHTIGVPALAPGFYIMSMTIGQSVSRLRLMNTGTELHISHFDISSDIAGFSRRAAASDPVDVLIVSKDGYETVQYEIADYVETDIEIVMEPEAMGLDNYNEEFKELAGCDCDLPEPSLLSSPDHSLPDPFLMHDGSRMSSLSEWACQRAWLQKNIETFVHGEKPRDPESVTGTVTKTGVTANISHGGKSASYSVSINLPPGASGPVPGMFQCSGTGVPTNFLHGEGVAAMSYSNDGAESAYNKIYGNGTGVSVQIKWAWGISRIIDVLVSERDAGKNDIIDPTALGTTGCSFAGKSAFTVGAMDERIALGIPMESGTGGLASYRVVGDKDLGPNGGEDPEQVREACSNDWFSRSFCSANVDAVPADAHFMVAMYAPRGFTTLQNDRIGHLAPVAQFTAAAAGAEVFKALGIEKNVGYHGGNDTDPHNHCTFYKSQEETARNAIRAFLTKTEDPNNFMEPKLKNRNDSPVDWDISNYINWDTPSLD